LRVAIWKGQEVFKQIGDQALANGELFMDDVVADAQHRCPIGSITREGKFVSARISFTPKTGRGKGKLVQFQTDKRWQGRNPGDLRNTIRRVTKRGKKNVRVYAGNFKIYWAYMVERGTKKSRAQPFLRPSFNGRKDRAISVIKNGK